MTVLRMSATVWENLHDYLDHPVERMAFLAALPDENSSTAADVWTVIDIMYLDDATDYAYQGWGGMELADEIRPRSLQWSTRLGAALVEVHSHGTWRLPTTFSDVDLRGLLAGAPRLVWRLQGRPYGAIVFGGRRDFDGLMWRDRESGPTPISELVVGEQTLKPTARALNRIAALEVLDE